MKLNILLPSLKEQKKASYKRCLCRVYNYQIDPIVVINLKHDLIILEICCRLNRTWLSPPSPHDKGDEQLNHYIIYVSILDVKRGET